MGQIPSKNWLLKQIAYIIAETNGISIRDTVELLLRQREVQNNGQAQKLILQFLTFLDDYSINRAKIDDLLSHPVSQALEEFFRQFPLKYHEEHIHLTGSLSADFLYPRLEKLLSGPNQSIYRKKLQEVYGPEGWPIASAGKVNQLIRLRPNQGFRDYLRILYLPKMILLDRESHFASAYHLAEELYFKFNVGKIRLKFSVSRSSTVSHEQIPGADEVDLEDVILGLWEGFRHFQKRYPDFQFILSPSFRKEAGFFDAHHFKTRKAHFEHLVDRLVQMLDQHPGLADVFTDVDTVGNENELYRKGHFNEFKKGFRKLQYRGIRIRSHHGETFHTLRKGIQAVDNAMNIWHIDTLEHGLSLGINPNIYFHRLFQRVMEKNESSKAIKAEDPEFKELVELDWPDENHPVLQKLLLGQPLTEKERTQFLKAKFHTAREVEHYQHDVLNRMIQKGVNLITLPSSNNKLTGHLEDYKEHPFSWWEKKGVQLGLGTDNYITLNTDYIKEMLILLYSDPKDLKITKLLMVTTHEQRRPFISHLLWRMHKQFSHLEESEY